MRFFFFTRLGSSTSFVLLMDRYYIYKFKYGISLPHIGITYYVEKEGEKIANGLFAVINFVIRNGILNHIFNRIFHVPLQIIKKNHNYF